MHRLQCELVIGIFSQLQFSIQVQLTAYEKQNQLFFNPQSLFS